MGWDIQSMRLCRRWGRGEGVGGCTETSSRARSAFDYIPLVVSVCTICH